MQQNMNLSMTPYNQAGAFVCSQYDVGRTCQIQLVDDNGAYEIPTGATVTVMATKPSGLGFSVECTWSGSTVTFTTTNTMTNEFGRFPAEIRIEKDSLVLGTTNFFFKVERSPHPDEVIDGDVIIQKNLVARVTTLEAKVATAEEDITDLKADIGDLDELETTDKSSLVGAINEARGSGGSGLTADIKTALLQIAQKVAYIDEDGQDYYDDLYDALYAITAITLNTNSISLQSIGATSQLTATTTPAGGNVTWSSSNTSVATVSSSGLVTSVAYGSATITATAGSVSATCSVTVVQATLTSISAVYTQSETVYNTDTLDTLKSDLVVTATWSNQTTSVVSSDDYTLSGTLAEGTSTITVSYGGKTAIFNVTVSVAYYKWDSTSTSAIWDDKDMIIGVSSPSELSFVPCGGISGGTGSGDHCHPKSGIGRATSTSQILVGVSDGQTIGLSSYTLSTGATVAYCLWYGYIDESDNSFNGTQYISNANTFVASAWLSDSQILPSSTVTGQRFLLIGFKKGDSSVDFTTAELTELSNIIQIS